MHCVNQFFIGKGLGLAAKAICAVAAVLVLSAVGCGPVPPALKNPVKGKVTLDGKGIVSNVVFVGADNKELPPVLSTNGGDYQVDLPAGDYKVAVRGMGGAVNIPIGPEAGGVAGGAAMPGGATMPSGAAGPPAVYSSVDTSGLTFKHPGGKKPQVFDIPLKSS